MRQVEGYTPEQSKMERQIAFGSLSIKNGEMIIKFADKGNFQSFKKYIKKILWDYCKAPKIILILDNVRFLQAKLLKQFLEKNNKI